MQGLAGTAASSAADGLKQAHSTDFSTAALPADAAACRGCGPQALAADSFVLRAPARLLLRSTASCCCALQLDSFEREVVEYVKPNHGTTTLGFIFQVQARGAAWPAM